MQEARDTPSLLSRLRHGRAENRASSLRELPLTLFILRQKLSI